MREVWDALKNVPKMAADIVAKTAYSQGMQHFVAHGAHEVAAGIFNGNQGGSSFVMYPRGSHDNDPQHTQDQKQEQKPELKQSM